MAVLKSLLAICASTLLAGALSGCAPQFDEKLIATCDGIRTNLQTYREWPTALADYEFASANYMATNIGDEKRAEFALFVNEAYPWMHEFADHAAPAFYYSGVEGALWQIATRGTPVEYQVSANDKAEYLDDNGKNLEDILGYSIASILGDGYETGCALYDQKRLEESESADKDDTAYLAWPHSQTVVNKIAELYDSVSECIDTGKYLGSACAKDDYVSTWDWSNYPTEPTNPWERTWSSDWLESLAKTAWCINNGYRDYRKSQDSCVD